MPDFGSWATAWWKPILFVIVAGHLTNVSVTLFLHRAQTHRGVKLHMDRSAFDDNVSATVCHGFSPLRLLRLIVLSKKLG